MKWNILGVATVLAGLVASTAAFADSIMDTLKLESVHTGSIRVGHANIPLPDGDWTIIALNETKNDQKNVLAAVTLASFSDQKFAGHIVLETNLDLSSSGWVVYPFCQRSDVYFIKKDIDFKNDQACWGVNHYVYEKTSTYKPAQGKSIQSYLAGRGQVMPGTMIGAIFRFADRGNFLTYQFYSNPTIHGFPDEAGKWADNSWHKDLVGTAPNKVEFLERIKAQAAPLYDAMKDGGLYAERAAANAKAPAGTRTTPGIEQRLTTLQNLYDRQLITPAEYEAKRKEILDGL